jgi:hypothetical protein
MGMDLNVTLPQGQPPPWPAVRDLLAQRGLPVQLRMIDGELAFPDEQPPEGWRELRISGTGGMVTLRREAERVVCVIWGNATDELRQLWQAVAEAVAQASGGRVG